MLDNVKNVFDGDHMCDVFVFHKHKIVGAPQQLCYLLGMNRNRSDRKPSVRDIS